jgi:hypothetical protein
MPTEIIQISSFNLRKIVPADTLEVNTMLYEFLTRSIESL